jgi:hypothetical protein
MDGGGRIILKKYGGRDRSGFIWLENRYQWRAFVNTAINLVVL